MAECLAWKDLFNSSVMSGNPDDMRAAVAHGLPLNERFGAASSTPLHIALLGTAIPAVVAVLVQAGADVNARTADGAAGGRTPLMLAASSGNCAVVKLLLTAGADVSLADNNTMTAVSHATRERTAAHDNCLRDILAAGGRADNEALFWAATGGTPGMVRRLVAAGADVNATCRVGTPLIGAARGNRPDTAELLLSLGADPKLPASSIAKYLAGQSPMDIARRDRRRKLLRLFEAAIAGEQPWNRARTPVGDINAVWDRLEAVLAVANLTARNALREGMTEERLARSECSLGIRLPNDLRFHLLRHDGQEDGNDALFPKDFLGIWGGEHFILLPVDEIESYWKMWKEAVEDDAFGGRMVAADEGVRERWWSIGWIPFACDHGGSYLCVDVDPAEGGVVGQIVDMRHDSRVRRRLAKSLTEFFADLCDHYESEMNG